MRGGFRGRYVAHLKAGSNLVYLDPEIPEAFPTDASVNWAFAPPTR